MVCFIKSSDFFANVLIGLNHRYRRLACSKKQLTSTVMDDIGVRKHEGDNHKENIENMKVSVSGSRWFWWRTSIGRACRFPIG